MKQKITLSIGILFILNLCNFTGCDSNFDSLSYNSDPATQEALTKGIWGDYSFEQIYKDEPYNEAHPEQLTYDYYRPQGIDDQDLPLVVFVHSGAFVEGDKENHIISKYAKDICSTGKYAVALVNYRLIENEKINELLKQGAIATKKYGSKVIFEATADVKQALVYFQRNNNTKNLGIDPEKIFVVGFGAGGLIANQIIFTDQDEAVDYIQGYGSDDYIARTIKSNGEETDFLNIDNGEYLDIPAKEVIKGAVSISAGVLDYNHIEDSDGADVSMLFIHGTGDRVFPIGNGYPFSKYNREEKFSFSSFCFNLGMSKSIQEAKPGVNMPSEWKRLFTNSFTTELCGSKCMYERLENKENCELSEFYRGPHIFMLNENGKFTMSYYDSREMILQFIMDNTK